MFPDKHRVKKSKAVANVQRLAYADVLFGSPRYESGWVEIKMVEKRDEPQLPDKWCSKVGLVNDSCQTYAGDSQKCNTRDPFDSFAFENALMEKDRPSHDNVQDIQAKTSSAIDLGKDAVSIKMEESYAEKPKTRERLVMDYLDFESFNRAEILVDPIKSHSRGSKSLKNRSYGNMDNQMTIDIESLQKKVAQEVSADPMLTKSMAHQMLKTTIPAQLFSHPKLSSHGHLPLKTRRTLIQTQDKAIADEAVRYLSSIKNKSWIDGLCRSSKSRTAKPESAGDFYNRYELPDRGKTPWELTMNSASKSASNSKSRAGHVILLSRPNSPPRRNQSTLIGRILPRKLTYTFEYSPRVNTSSQTSKIKNASLMKASELKSSTLSRSRDMSRSNLNSITRLIDTIGYN
jgi:hypothetical protein